MLYNNKPANNTNANTNTRRVARLPELAVVQQGEGGDEVLGRDILRGNHNDYPRPLGGDEVLFI